MASQGWRVTIEHGREGYRVAYENAARKTAGSVVAPFFLEAITDAVHDVIDLERLMVWSDYTT